MNTDQFWCIRPGEKYIWVDPKNKAVHKFLPKFNKTIKIVKTTRPDHVRCPKCGRRLVPRTINVEEGSFAFEEGYVIPPHKIRKTKRYKKVNGKKVSRV